MILDRLLGRCGRRGGHGPPARDRGTPGRAPPRRRSRHGQGAGDGAGPGEPVPAAPAAPAAAPAAPRPAPVRPVRRQGRECPWTGRWCAETVVTRDGWPLHGGHGHRAVRGSGAASARTTTGNGRDASPWLDLPAGHGHRAPGRPGPRAPGPGRHHPPSEPSPPVTAPPARRGAGRRWRSARSGWCARTTSSCPRRDAGSSTRCTPPSIATAHHLGLSSVRGRLDVTEGVIAVAEPFTDSTVEVTIAAASIDTGVGQRDEHLRSGDFLDVATHPLHHLPRHRSGGHHVRRLDPARAPDPARRGPRGPAGAGGHRHRPGPVGRHADRVPRHHHTSRATTSTWTGTRPWAWASPSSAPRCASPSTSRPSCSPERRRASPRPVRRGPCRVPAQPAGGPTAAVVLHARRGLPRVHITVAISRTPIVVTRVADSHLSGRRPTLRQDACGARHDNREDLGRPPPRWT